MARYRDPLPQLSSDVFLTDGGLETTLIFRHGIELPAFAAFVLVDRAEGRETLREYYRGYADLARRHGLGLIVDTPTWRANPAWGHRLGYSSTALRQANVASLEVLADLRGELPAASPPVVLSASVGPRSDGYRPSELMTPDQAQAYHAEQIGIFAEGEADMVSAYTLNYVEEAVGIARAARAADVPLVLSFTVETDGHLPTGQALGDAILEVDAATEAAPTYYMINCAHPLHFDRVLAPDAPWIRRLRGLKVNASRLSHAELDEAQELDSGRPDELGLQVEGLRARVPHVNVVGGCCGTDERHIDRIARACKPRRGGVGVPETDPSYR